MRVELISMLFGPIATKRMDILGLSIGRHVLFFRILGHIYRIVARRAVGSKWDL